MADARLQAGRQLAGVGLLASPSGERERERDTGLRHISLTSAILFYVSHLPRPVVIRGTCKATRIRSNCCDGLNLIMT